MLSVLVKNITVENQRWQYGEYGSYVGCQTFECGAHIYHDSPPSLLCSDSVALGKADSAGRRIPDNRLISVGACVAELPYKLRATEPAVLADLFTKRRRLGARTGNTTASFVGADQHTEALSNLAENPMMLTMTHRPPRPFVERESSGVGGEEFAKLSSIPVRPIALGI